MARVLIIGYGNPLRGDDRVGWVVAERIEPMVVGRDVEVITAHQLMPELAETLSRAEQAFFVDASVDEPPGHWSRREIRPPDDWTIRDSHQLDPAKLLALARSLYGHAPVAALYSIGAADLGLKEELSPVVQAAAEEVIAEIVDVCTNFP